MQDIRLALITGVDIPIPQCQLILHQPKLKEIALLGEKNFFTGIQCLNINKNMYTEDETLLQDLSNFQIFMKVVQDPRALDKKDSMIQVLSLLLPNCKVAFLPNSFIITCNGQTSSIDEKNFDLFQNILSEIFCLKSTYDKSGFNPNGKKAKAIADKLMKARQKVAEEKGDGNASMLVTYMSCISVALHLSIQKVSEYTLFQLYDQMERYGLYLAWDVDMRARMAGAKPDESPDNWMKNIH